MSALVAALLLSCARPEVPVAEEPPVEVRAQVEPAVATIGDLLSYTVEVERDPGIEVAIAIPEGSIGGLAIVDEGSDEVDDRGRTTTTRWATLRADPVGSYILPPPEVRTRTGEEPWTEHETSRIFIEVLSVLPEEGAEDIRGLKPLQRPPRVPVEVLLGVLAGATAVLLALLARWAWRRHRHRPPPPPLPAHELAIAELRALRESPLTDLERVRVWYFELSAVLRRYIEARFAVNATDLTSEEIAQRLGGRAEVPDAEEERLVGFLDATDAVKYAARPPSPADIDAVYDRAVGFVRGTVPVEPAPTTAEGP